MAGIDVTAITKLKHADLWAAANKLGSQAELARHLGVCQSRLNSWINFKVCPPTEPVGDIWTEEFLLELDKKMFVLVGKCWAELFDDTYRRYYPEIYKRRHFEKTANLTEGALESYAADTTKRLTFEFPDEDMEILQGYLKRLPTRERDVIKMRVGMEGNPKTLRETGEELGICVERTRQIEMRAYRRLRGFAEAEYNLSGFNDKRKEMGLDPILKDRGFSE